MEQARVKVKVVNGKGRGKGLGIPTLNFEIPDGLTLKHGVYAAQVIIDNETYAAALHFGPRPAFNEEDVSLEAYLLDGLLDKTPKEAELVFVTYIRPIMNFENPDAMMHQINRDIINIKASLSETP